MTGDTAGGHDVAGQAGAIDASTTGDTCQAATPTGPQRGADHRAETVTQRRALLAGLGGLAAGAMFASRAGAGPLNPPAGPITSTGKTLTEVEPRIAVNATNTPGDAGSMFRITQPGSYYLTGNVLGESGKGGISIEASNVTLDLNGFGVIGVAGAGIGIRSVGARSHLIIRNGSVTNWPGDGVNLFSAGAGGGALIESVIAASNEGLGIAAPADSCVIGCIARSNGGVGFSGSSTLVMQDCLARTNGSFGFQCGNGCVLTNCAARNNTGSGFSLGPGATLHNCSAYLNAQDGFVLGAGCVITACTAENNLNRGFVGVSRCMFSVCSARLNASDGISALSDSFISNCVASLNGQGGSGAGILVSGNDARIDGNLCTRNVTGVEVSGSGNFITRNTCSGSTSVNWSISASNACLVVAALPASAINGNAGGIAPGSADPNTNFTF